MVTLMIVLQLLNRHDIRRLRRSPPAFSVNTTDVTQSEKEVTFIASSNQIRYTKNILSSSFFAMLT